MLLKQITLISCRQIFIFSGVTTDGTSLSETLISFLLALHHDSHSLQIFEQSLDAQNAVSRLTNAFTSSSSILPRSSSGVQSLMADKSMIPAELTYQIYNKVVTPCFADENACIYLMLCSCSYYSPHGTVK